MLKMIDDGLQVFICSKDDESRDERMQPRQELLLAASRNDWYWVKETWKLHIDTSEWKGEKTRPQKALEPTFTFALSPQSWVNFPVQGGSCVKFGFLFLLFSI